MPSNKDGQIPDSKSWPAFKNSKIKPEDAVPAHKSNRDKCLSIKKEALKQQSQMSQDFTENACTCIGCCSGKGNRELSERERALYLILLTFFMLFSPR